MLYSIIFTEGYKYDCGGILHKIQRLGGSFFTLSPFNI